MSDPLGRLRVEADLLATLPHRWRARNIDSAQSLPGIRDVPVVDRHLGGDLYDVRLVVTLTTVVLVGPQNEGVEGPDLAWDDAEWHCA
jgi:hypothetical protein